MNHVIRIMVLWVGLSISHAAGAATTPFGFELSQSLESQLKPCTEQTSQLCYEAIDKEGRLAAYALKT